MKLRTTYNAIIKLQHELEAELIPVGAKHLMEYPHHKPQEADYRKIKALAATYELQEYLADMIPDADDIGTDLTVPDTLEMEGEPVWIWKDRTGGWEIIDCVDVEDDMLTTREGRKFKLSELGVTWLAYRERF